MNFVSETSSRYTSSLLEVQSSKLILFSLDGTNCSASSTYLNTAVDFHRPKKEMLVKDIPLLAYPMAPDLLAECPVMAGLNHLCQELTIEDFFTFSPLVLGNRYSFLLPLSGSASSLNARPQAQNGEQSFSQLHCKVRLTPLSL